MCIADGATDESGYNFGEADDGEADEGVDDGVFGFLEFGRVARGSDVSDSSDDDKASGD